MEFHETLQELRKSRGLTQEELASELFVSRAAISKWESGKGYPNIDSLKALSVFFNVSLDDLLSGEQILDVAETDYKAKEQRFKDIVCGLLDCAMIVLIFLPFFGQAENGSFIEVPLLNYTDIESYVIIPYFSGIGALVLLGILSLVFQNSENQIWRLLKPKVSLALSTLMVLLFIASRQPYAASLTFIFLVVKVSALLKRA